MRVYFCQRSTSREEILSARNWHAAWRSSINRRIWLINSQKISLARSLTRNSPPTLKLGCARVYTPLNTPLFLAKRRTNDSIKLTGTRISEGDLSRIQTISYLIADLWLVRRCESKRLIALDRAWGKWFAHVSRVIGNLTRDAAFSSGFWSYEQRNKGTTVERTRNGYRGDRTRDDRWTSQRKVQLEFMRIPVIEWKGTMKLRPWVLYTSRIAGKLNSRPMDGRDKPGIEG